MVMSYEKDFYWVKNLSKGIREVLGQEFGIEWEYLPGKKNPGACARAGEQIMADHKDPLPDGIIAADDLAQTHFVVPFIKDKTSVPTVFVGVNQSPEKYGYPAGNVTGIREKLPVAQTLAFTTMLLPHVRKVAFMVRKSRSSKGILEQIAKDAPSFPVNVVSVHEPRTYEEALDIASDLRDTTDLLYAVALNGLPDAGGTPQSGATVFKKILEIFDKPVLGATVFHVQQGALLTVALDGRLQGRMAAAMLKKAMSGVPMKNLPIVTNIPGKRVLNLVAMRTMGINPRPAALVDTCMVLPAPGPSPPKPTMGQ